MSGAQAQAAVLDPAVVDLDRVAGWMDAQGLGAGPIGEVVLLQGGTQNVLVRFTRADRAYVLRRPPEHKRDSSDETMRREARVLAALAGSDVPHPALIAACPDTDVIGAAFYLMEPIDGFNPTSEWPEPHRSDMAMQRELGLAMADGIAALGRVDASASSVAGLGRPEGWLERQVERWRWQLDGYHELDGYPGADIPGVDTVASWLETHRPTRWRAGLIHGDYHFANVLVHRDRGALAAIVDWELATVGDPLLDLGHVLATWPGEGGAAAATTFQPPGLPTPGEVLDRYADGTDRDLTHIRWYQVLACYRLGIILEGTHARACAGQASRETGDLLHGITVGLFEQALDLLD